MRLFFSFFMSRFLSAGITKLWKFNLPFYFLAVLARPVIKTLAVPTR